MLAVAGSYNRELAAGGNALGVLGVAASGTAVGANRLLLNMASSVSPAQYHRLVVPAGLQDKLSSPNLGSRPICQLDPKT